MIVKRNKQQIDITLHKISFFKNISLSIILDIPLNDKLLLLLRLWLQFIYIYNIIYIIEKNPTMDLLQNVDDKREVEFYINCYIITSYEKNLNNVLYLPLQRVSVFAKVSVIVTIFVMS